MNQILKALTITSFILVFVLTGLVTLVEDPNKIGPYILLPFGTFFIFGVLLSKRNYGEALIFNERITKTSNPVKYYMSLSLPFIMGVGILITGIFLIFKKN